MDAKNVEVREMRNAETVLNIIRERGKRGLPLERVYRLLYRRDLYLGAYAKLYSNVGAMTKGTTPETVDGMSMQRIDAIIEALRTERYEWQPVRRVYISKANGKKRPLGMPTWSDKLLQEVLRSILEAYFEPKFSRRSHGFRPGKGCHTALQDVMVLGKGTKWFIEGDLASCFDRIDHQVLLGILRERIHDGRFIHLIEKLLKAGYLEECTFNATYSGVPQGGVLSPLLSNLVLDRLDRYVEEDLIPAHTRGSRRKSNPEYVRRTMGASRARKRGDFNRAKALMKEARMLPSKNPNDADYRRLWYVRYADDFLLGYIGAKSEAVDIKEKIGRFLRDELRLELNDQKTLVTHAQTGRARFLGYEVHTLKCDSWRNARGQRHINSNIGLRVPRDVVQKHCSRYMRRGKPVHLAQRLQDDAYSIIARYQAEYRGLVQYYVLAHNLHALNRVHWATRLSLLKTLAHKYRTSVKKVAGQLSHCITTPDGTYKALQVVVEREGKKALEAHFGAVPLKRNPWASVREVEQRIWSGRSELIERLLAEACELCGASGNTEVHHVRKLADLESGKAEWQQRMAARRRKTLVVCGECHDRIHAGTYDGKKLA